MPKITIGTLPAVLVFLVLSAITFWLYVGYERVKQEEQDMLKAGTLAEEGLDVMKEFRDANFSRFSSKADRVTGANPCWNTLPAHTDVRTCENPENKIQPGTYRLEKDAENSPWELFPALSRNEAPDFSRTITVEYLEIPASPASVESHAMQVISAVRYRGDEVTRATIFVNQPR